MIVVALYLLYFFLRDGERLVDGMVRALPLGDERERRLFHRFASITRATIKGTFIVGAIQGALGGIAFAILGIRAAIFWGVIMTVISLLPAVGSVLVWGPAAIILMLTGSLVKGIVLLVIGIAIISTVDNVLRPVLVGRETRMPDWLVFVSILGGIAAVGLSGFVIGPIVAGLFITVWEMFVEEYGHVDRADPGLPEPVARPPAVEPPPVAPARVDPPEAPPAGEGPAIEQPL
jgi:predicted PurR-regulated permease PerM